VAEDDVVAGLRGCGAGGEEEEGECEEASHVEYETNVVGVSAGGDELGVTTRT
jgi:hypothetical protein